MSNYEFQVSVTEHQAEVLQGLLAEKIEDDTEYYGVLQVVYEQLIEYTTEDDRLRDEVEMYEREFASDSYSTEAMDIAKNMHKEDY